MAPKKCDGPDASPKRASRHEEEPVTPKKSSTRGGTSGAKAKARAKAKASSSSNAKVKKSVFKKPSASTMTRHNVCTVLLVL